MRYLLIGDPHATPSTLDECAKLMEFCYQQATEHSVDKIVVMGDLHHTHAMVRVEVTHFWREVLLKSPCNVILLVGNHDLASKSLSEDDVHALVSYKELPNVTVIDFPMVIDGMGFLPYRADVDVFVKEVNSLSVPCVFVHQSFIGADLGGITCIDGVNLDRVNVPKIISGHIHSQQLLGHRVHYVGSPRWLTITDANQDRGIWLFDTDTQQADFIDTSGVCKRIVLIDLNVNSVNTLPSISEQTRTIVNLTGTKTWIAEQLKTIKLLQLPNVEVRSIYMDDCAPELKASEGIVTALHKFIVSRDWGEISADVLWKTITARLTEGTSDGTR